MGTGFLGSLIFSAGRKRGATRPRWKYFPGEIRHLVNAWVEAAARLVDQETRAR